ncbi:MAG: pyrimidine utilization protein D [Novosphingobium sp.]
MYEVGGIHYETHGDEHLPPLVLSSGLGGSCGYWTPNIRALAEHFHVIAYDHRGTGHSDRTVLAATSVADMAADVALMLDDFEVDRVHFIGHALGAMIGIELAMSGRVDKLVAINAWARLDPHTRRCFSTRLDLLRHAGPGAFVRAQPLFLYPPDWISTHDAELADETRRHHGAFPEQATVEARIAAVQAWQPAFDRRTPDAECLVIGTRDDFLVPVARSRELAEALPGAQYREFEWGGHAVNVTDPAAFNATVIDFLRS